ncbi:MAG: protoporphyrinogen oxidase [Cytophagaceae bacterium]
MIAIIGGGISGLTLAYELQKKNIEYILLESSSQAGGVIDSYNDGKHLVEAGPNTILADDKIKAFINELGISSEIVEPTFVSKNRFILKNGEYRQIPTSPKSFFTDDFFSWNTKLAIIAELIKKPNPQKNESLRSFFERRFNKQIADYIIDPLASGIYAGNIDELLVEKTFPFLTDLETKYGSIIKGFITSKKTAGRKDSLTFRHGMKHLPLTLASKLNYIRTYAKVTNIIRLNESFIISINNGLDKIIADKVVLAAPAYAASAFLRDEFPEFSEILGKINYVPMAKVATAFKKADVTFSFDGYGGLNPTCERAFSLGSMWTSSVYPFTAPEDEILITTMVGGACNRDKVLMSDNQISANVLSEIKEFYGISSTPVYQNMIRIPQAIPQFDKRVLPLDNLSSKMESGGIYICANWKDGASISDCIKKGIKMAEMLQAEQLSLV